jgi:hypothetical protein
MLRYPGLTEIEAYGLVQNLAHDWSQQFNVLRDTTHLSRALTLIAEAFMRMSDLTPEMIFALSKSPDVSKWNFL